MLWLTKAIKNNRGQALVEFALILPVLLLLVVGMMEFGIVMNEYIVMTQAAREGARSAALGGNNAMITSTIINAADQIDTSQLTITISPVTTRIRGDSVTVTIQKPVQSITQLMAPFFPAGFTIQSTSTMRVE